jgi:hypothetical protein
MLHLESFIIMSRCEVKMKTRRWSNSDDVGFEDWRIIFSKQDSERKVWEALERFLSVIYSRILLFFAFVPDTNIIFQVEISLECFHILFRNIFNVFILNAKLEREMNERENENIDFHVTWYFRENIFRSMRVRRMMFKHSWSDDRQSSTCHRCFWSR